MQNQISQTIFQQLGGGKFVAMTYANLFVATERGLQFSFKGCQGINKCRITLQPSDTYKVEFFKMNRTGESKFVHEVLDVYADSLQECFTMHTGLYTHL